MQPASIGDMLRQGATTHGEKTALICPDRSLSFAELDRMSNRFAAGLQRLGLQPGDRVTLYGENGWEWIVAYYGILKAGAVVNPLNVMLTTDEIRFIIEDCGARLAVAMGEKCASLLTLCADTPLEHVIGYGAQLPPDAIPFDTVLRDAAFAVPSITSRTLATIGYTSGTTGRPKGAMLSHRSIVTNTLMTALMHGRVATDLVVSALPCAHVYGNVVLNAAMLRGMTLVLFPRFDAATILAAIERHRATIFEGVPTMYAYLLNCATFDTHDLGSLRICTVGGQTMPLAAIDEVRRRFGCPLIELWGMTEIGGLGATHPHTGPLRPGSIGIALPFTTTRILDLEDPTRICAQGETGELAIRGPIVMDGYFGNQDATDEVIDADGWLRTGDVARADEDGFIFIVDRKKDMILTGGFNVYPAEIERVLARHESVALAAVCGVPHAMKGEVAKAFIVLRTGHAASADELDRFCREHLAAYKIPREYSFVSTLPQTSTGKIMRRALRAMGIVDHGDGER